MYQNLLIVFKFADHEPFSSILHFATFLLWNQVLPFHATARRSKEENCCPPNVTTDDGQNLETAFLERRPESHIAVGQISSFEKGRNHMRWNKWKRSSSTWRMEWVYKQHLVGEVLKMEQKVTKVHLSSGSVVLVEDRLAQRGCC